MKFPNKRLTESADKHFASFPEEMRKDCSYNLDSDIIVERLGAYEDLVDRNQLLLMQAGIGNYVYLIFKPENYTLGVFHARLLDSPQKKKVKSISVSKRGIVYNVGDQGFRDEDFGNVIFTSYEEAKSNLDRLKEENQEVLNRYFNMYRSKE